MTQHDTPEAVEALFNRVHRETRGGGMVRWCAPDVANEAAAMLRRLHKRAVDAERLLTRAHEALPECYVSLQKDILALINKEPRT